MATVSGAVIAADSSDDPGIIVQHFGEERGHGLVAVKTFVKGQTILREKPLVSSQFSWNASAGYKACHFCMEPLESAQENVSRLTGDPNVLLPHTECCSTRVAFHITCPHCGVGYCSKQCLEEAWASFHATLCVRTNPPDATHPLVQLDELWKTIHYPPETCSIQLIIRLLATLVQADTQELRDSLAQKYLSFLHSASSDQEHTCLKILGDKFAEPLERLRLASIQLFAAKPDHIDWFLTPDGFISLFALVGRNGQGVGSSSFATWVKRLEKDVQARLQSKDSEKLDTLIDTIYTAIENFAGLQFMNNEGTGLYAIHSKANHSCNPNAEVAFPFNNNELVLNATRSIEPGEEILISYLDECDRERSRHSRQKILRENYLFTCGCCKCGAESADPDITSEEEMESDDEEEEDGM